MNIQLFPLHESGFLHASGAEADAFLQGQLSSDLRQLSATRAQFSSLSTAKGRMLALPLLLRRKDDSVLLELPASLVDPTLKRLKMFVLRAKVTLIAPGEPLLQSLGLMGTDANAWLRAQNLPTPETGLDCAHTMIDDENLTVVRRPGATARYSVIGTPQALQRLRATHPQTTGDDAIQRWRRAEIEAGVPVVYPQTRELFIPQMLNLDLLGGIGFDKGCYTGQEIVARLHYLGQVKRRMFVVEIAGAAPQPGSAIITDGDQAAGEIVDAVDLGGGRALASAVIQLSQRDQPLRLKESGNRMMVLSGPEI